jgi:hypothetical protein
MAVTRISDVVVPAVFAPYVQVLTTQKSAFVQSGVMVPNPAFDALLAGGGKTFDMPHWNDLADTEANVSSDDPAATSTPDKIGSGQDVAIRQNRNHSWSTADLSGQLAGDDPMEAIAQRVAAYWVRQEQSYVLNTLAGLIADNVANDGGDMVHDVANDLASAPVDADLMGGDVFLQAVQTMGDMGELITAVAVHSVVFRRMQVKNLIDFIPQARGEIAIPTYLGRRVIIDDGLPAVAGVNRVTYTSYLFGQGALARGESPPPVPAEVDRKPDQGNGAGVDVLHSRRQLMIHPRGIAWQSASLAGQSPTNAELANATNWNRVWDRKLIRLAALKTNG